MHRGIMDGFDPQEGLLGMNLEEEDLFLSF